jgi:hypothetical protein
MDMANSHDASVSVEEMEWSEIHEPGCYLHIGSGLLARVFLEELADMRSGHALVGRVARLATSPHLPVTTLRLIATRSGYRVSF